MIEQPVSATRYAPRQLTGHAILATALAPILGMGAIQWLRIFGLSVAENPLNAAIAIATTWILYFLLCVYTNPRRQGWGAFRALSDPDTPVAAKLRFLVTNPWGIAMLAMFALGVVNLIVTFG